MYPSNHLRIKLFADGADMASIMRLYRDPIIQGFTTNPTLMRKAGISDYERFSRDLLEAIPDRPISLEVFADDLPTMGAQAREIATWGSNVVVKVPITNTIGETTSSLIKQLADEGISLNITAVMTVRQVREVAPMLNPDVPAIVSVFAGRIADTGTDPVPIMRSCLEVLRFRPRAELLWASPRELLNLFQASEIGTHIITATPDILAKLKLVGKDLTEYSLETVRMFYNDATAAGFELCGLGADGSAVLSS